MLLLYMTRKKLVKVWVLETEGRRKDLSKGCALYVKGKRFLIYCIKITEEGEYFFIFD
jgi:hypothetical protein